MYFSVSVCWEVLSPLGKFARLGPMVIGEGWDFEMHCWGGVIFGQFRQKVHSFSSLAHLALADACSYSGMFRTSRELVTS